MALLHRGTSALASGQQRQELKVRTVGIARCQPLHSLPSVAPSGASQSLYYQQAGARQLQRLCCRAMQQAEKEQGKPGETVARKDDEASKALALACAQICDETKALDITVLHVAPLVSWTSYMVIATIFSRPQLLAVLARIERMVEADFPDRARNNQPGTSPWECLDYGDVVVHIMTAEQRQTYGLDDFYARAQEVDLPWEVPVAPTAAGSKDAAAAAGPKWSIQAN